MYLVEFNMECPGENLVKVLGETAKRLSHYVEIKPLRETPPKQSVVYIPNMCLWSRQLEFGGVPYEEVDSNIKSIRVSKVRPTKNAVTHLLFGDFFWKWTAEAIVDERKSYGSIIFDVYTDTGIVEEVGKWDVRKYRRRPLRDHEGLHVLDLLMDEFKQSLRAD
jgi:hypothetical protein